MKIDDLSTVSCQGCGVYDASLRCSSHPTVVSVLVTANQSACVGIWCARCRAIESAKAAAITLLAGAVIATMTKTLDACLSAVR
jgi:hypothetical protein